MAFGHVGAPQEIGIPQIQIVEAAHRLVRTEGGHKTGHGRGHAKPCIGLYVVGADPTLEELAGGIPLEHGPLAGTIDGNRIGTMLGDGFLEFAGNQCHGLIPGSLDHLVALADEWLRQAVLAV